VPLLVPQAFLERLLVEQVFTEPGETVRVTAVADPCNEIVLSEPRIRPARGRLVVSAHARAEAGVSWLGGCLRPLTWEGEIEAEQAVRLAPATPVALFTVANSSLRGGGGGWLDVRSLWGWVKPLVHPRLETLRVDLGPLVAELRRVLPLFAAHPEAPAVRRLVDSIALADVRVEERGLVLRLRFEVDTGPPPQASAGREPPLTHEQIRAFEEALREWDAFVTFVVKVGGHDALSPALRADLLAALLDAREELVAALEEPAGRANDRVRALFAAAWARLAPLLAELAGGDDGYRYLAFVASGDALAALDAAGPAFGIEISSDGLRRLARTLAPAATADPLAWSDEVDPELRETFGFGAELPALPPPGASEPAAEAAPPGEAIPGEAVPGAAPPGTGLAPPPEAPAEPLLREEPQAPAPEAPPELAPLEELQQPGPEAAPPPAPIAPAPEGLPPVPPEPEPPTSALDRLADAVAALLGAAPASAAPAPAPKPTPTRGPLDARAPRRAELDRYLPQVAELLSDAASRVFEHGDLGPERRDLFRHMVLAAAWQESCWRQYVERRGQIEPLRSRAGALGLMQVNPHVWRGFYAVDGLARSIRYNAHAGSEILLHYLRDYALARGEEARGGPDALARATYAAYNGGPSHLRRYREPQRWPASLAAIDRAFLAKFHAVAAGRELRVRECFPG
jgi:soluble lytic murein transglycosylase-like protein